MGQSGFDIHVAQLSVKLVFAPRTPFLQETVQCAYPFLSPEPFALLLLH